MLRDHVLLPFTGNGRNRALDGIRALAVLLVIVGHTAPDYLPGGGIGVDLFFVLSGYLITQVLLAGLAEHGNSLSGLLGFWAGRIRRLLPPLVIVIATIAVLAQRYGPPELWQRWRDDLWYALAYTANWRFIATDTDYDVLTHGQSPVIHLWSLAVEEQFYLLWPLLLLIPAVRRRLPLWALTGASVSLGFTLALGATGADPTRILLGTDTRAGQLLAGAWLGSLLWARRTQHQHSTTPNAPAPYAAPVDTPGKPYGEDARTSRPPRDRISRHATALTLGAITALLALAIIPLPDTPWSASGRILGTTVAGLALLLAAQAPKQQAATRTLGSAPLVFLGVTSYSVYLWHMPLLWLAKRLDPAGTWTQDTSLTGTAQLTLIVLTGSIALGLASWLILEGPLRALPLQTPTGQLRKPLLTIGAGTLLLGVAALAIPTWLKPTGIYASMAIEAQHYPCPDGSPVCQVRDTARPDEWGCEQWPCILYEPDTQPSATLLLTGDSVGRSLTVGLLQHAQANNWTVIAHQTGCSLVASPRFGYQPDNPGLPEFNEPDCRDPNVINWDSMLEQYPIDVVVSMTATMRNGVIQDNTAVYADQANYGEAYARNVETALNAITRHHAELVLVLMPHQTTAANCDTGRDYTPDTCILGRRYAIYEKPALLEHVAPHASAIVDLTALLCTTEPCGPGNPVLRHDGSHLSFTGTSITAPQIASAVHDVLDHRNRQYAN